ncbi:MAG: carboxylating nicotinate-nucleotide diphosphorylase [Bradyrhizobiaceae bacterium]|nr:carboxylating nicotinate-nucleotide diphosphorylase [Bradyrhizobiaceae bacterium]
MKSENTWLGSEFPVDSEVLRLIQFAIHEDVGPGDITSELTVHHTSHAAARFLLKTSGVVCGLPILRLVFDEFSADVNLELKVREGDWCEEGTVIATIEGSAHALLAGERTALNFIQRLSGVATLTRRYADRIQGTNARILDTRKTIPGWRVLDKYATRIGGALNHRMGLYDMVMIKDNHITAMGGITEAVTHCVQELRNNTSIKIEVEARSLDDVREILSCPGVHRVMFDNFTPAQVAEGVALVNKTLETEASGGITYGNIRDYAEAGVDFISVGAITHSAVALDISMKLFVPKGKHL